MISISELNKIAIRLKEVTHEKMPNLDINYWAIHVAPLRSDKNLTGAIWVTKKDIIFIQKEFKQNTRYEIPYKDFKYLIVVSRNEIQKRTDLFS